MVICISKVVPTNQSTQTASTQSTSGQTQSIAAIKVTPTPTAKPFTTTSTTSTSTQGSLAYTQSAAEKNSFSNDAKKAVLSEKTLAAHMDKKQISINLAWLLVLAPLILIGRFAKVVLARALPRR